MEQLRVGDESYGFHKLDAAATRLPYTLRIRPENVVRTGGGAEPVAGWVAGAEPSQEISFHPARVLLQDFTGVPAVVDLAAMRDAMREQGGDPKAINPQIPAELVIDHSVQVDEFASRLAIGRNVELEFERNKERYAFLRWGQGAFDNFRVGSLALADRATLGNMSPETGATCGFFPVDDVTLTYLRLTGRSDERIALVEAYCKENHLWHEPEEHPEYSQVVELDLDDVEPS